MIYTTLILQQPCKAGIMYPQFKEKETKNQETSDLSRVTDKWTICMTHSSPPFHRGVQIKPWENRIICFSTCYTAPLSWWSSEGKLVSSSWKSISETKVQPSSGSGEHRDPNTPSSISTAPSSYPHSSTISEIEAKAARIWKARSDPTSCPTLSGR